jgi:hypothetical protein
MLAPQHKMYHSHEPTSSEAKRLVRKGDMRSGNKPDLFGDYTDVLSSVVDAISKIAADDDGCSMTSLTLPESVMTHDSLHQICSDSVVGHHDKSYNYIEEQHDGEPMYWKPNDEDDERDGAAETDDEISVSSDFVPLAMTDEDAIDEIDFTRELMGYEEGFDNYNWNVRRILEEEDEEEEEECVELIFSPKQSKVHQTQWSANKRPPLPLAKQGQTHVVPPNGKPSHRRTLSGGNPNTTRQVLAHVGPPNSRPGHRRSHSGGSLPVVKPVPSQPVTLKRAMSPKPPTHRQPQAGGSISITKLLPPRPVAPMRQLGSNAPHVVPVAPPERKLMFPRRFSGHRSLSGRRGVTCHGCGRSVSESGRCTCHMQEV